MFPSTTIFIAIATIVLPNTSGRDILSFPEECNQETICYHRPDNYPADEIDHIIEEKMKKSNYTFFSQVDYSEDDIGDTYIGDENNCYTKIELKKPFGIKVGDSWKPVIQSKHFTQKIRHVTCQKEGASCLELDGYLSRLGKKGMCATKYGKLFMHFYDPIEKNMGTVNMFVPICCGCNIVEL